MEKFRKIGCFLIPFLLMYYIFMNPARKIMIPFSQVTVPVLLAVVFFLSILCARGRIMMRGYLDIIQCFSWLAIAVMISVYNADFIESLKTGGLIQFYVMVSFMLFSGSMGKSWIRYWLILTELFAVVYALATILFFFNEDLYVRYISAVFDEELAAECMEYYSRGWMTGLCRHFSTNGILLSIGVVTSFFLFLIVIKKKNRRFGVLVPVLHIVSGVLALYGLILSSKRSPLLSAIIAIAVGFVVSRRKKLFKRLVIVAVVAVAFYLIYEWLLPYIPGLSTIADKTEELTGTTAGIWNGREGLWDRALEMFSNSPLIGNGFGSFAGYAQETNAITSSAHNYYLQLLAEYGIFGTALYLVAFVSCAAHTISVIIRYGNEMTETDTLLLSFSLALQVYVLIYNFTATALMYYHVLIPLFLAYGATRTIRYSYENKNNPPVLAPQPAFKGERI